jgi:hypothetical protein
MNQIKTIAILLLILSTQIGLAQDLILKRNNEIIHCKIIEVGLDDVKYRLPDYPLDVSFAIAKDALVKIVFENGAEMEFSKELTNPLNYEDNKRNALKVEFLSPLFGNTTLAYERSLKPGRSIEGTLGIIGLGVDMGDDNNAGGVFIKGGYKFIKEPDYYLRGMRYTHILKGAYLKPELMLSMYSANMHYWRELYDQNGNWYSNEGTERIKVFSGAIHLIFGKQWIYDNAFLIDFYSGVGYGFQSYSRSNNYDYNNRGYHYGFTMGDDFPISFSAGLKIGFLFK